MAFILISESTVINTDHIVTIDQDKTISSVNDWSVYFADGHMITITPKEFSLLSEVLSISHLTKRKIL